MKKLQNIYPIVSNEKLCPRFYRLVFDAPELAREVEPGQFAPMKARLAKDAVRLEDIPNIGTALAEDLRQIGIVNPLDLKGKDGMELYHTLNRKTGARHDPCVADTFLAAVDFMNGGKAKPWWAFTPERKKIWKETW